MLSLVDPSGMRAHAELYAALLEVLPSQLSSMDQGFLEVSQSMEYDFLVVSGNQYRTALMLALLHKGR
jgi:hypothetical protein